MILVGNRRGGAAELAAHLLNVKDNEHVKVHEVRGFISDNLHGAYSEAYGISRGTRCKKYLYSLSLSPPETEDVSIEIFEAAIERIEQKLGFKDQPRTIVFHEKNARRHAHVVWSRIDAATMSAIDPYKDKLSLNEISRELFIEQGWNLPDGYKRKQDADPFNCSHAEHSQAKRVKRDPKALKKMFVECWAQSDGKASFASALKQNGLILAKGNRRGFVAVDTKGEIYSISRWVGIKSKEVRARLGRYDELPSVDEALLQFKYDKDNMPSQTTAGVSSHVQTEAIRNSNVYLKKQFRFVELENQRLVMVARHRNARKELEQRQEARRISQLKARAAKLPIGLKAIWFKLSGRYETMIRDNELAAKACGQRDRAEYQTLIEVQLKERRILQSEFRQLELEAQTFSSIQALQSDPSQTLVLPPDPEASNTKAKVQDDASYILTVITDKKESFTRSDVVRGLAEYIDDPLALGTAVDTVMRSDELVEIQSKPLQRYSTREMLVLKANLSEYVDELAQTYGIIIASKHINAAIAQQNKALKATVGASLSQEQEAAIRHCLSNENLSGVVGLAGAGKSTMVTAVRDAYERQGMNVIGAALSGKAADGLETSSGIKSRTLASLEYSWKEGYNQLTINDVLVIDEAGMIGTRQLHRIMNEVLKRKAKVILIGDPEQLQPINAGTPFKEITEQIKTTKLTEIHRQKEDWQKQASLDLAEQRIEVALNAYEAHGFVKEARDTSEAIALLVEDYMADAVTGANTATSNNRDTISKLDQPSNNESEPSRLALAYRRKDVFAINQAIRSARLSIGELSDEVLLQTKHGKRALAKSDRILLTENNHSLAIQNGMLGTVHKVDENSLEIILDSADGQHQRQVSIHPKLYQSFDHGYATTIHKSQGATVDQTYVLGSHLMDRHLTYVAMTRHRQNATLYGDYNSLRKIYRSGETQSESKYEKQNNLNFSKLLKSHNRGPTMH